MQLKEISIDDIQRKAYWKIVSYNTSDPELSDVVEVHRVSSKDIIAHPAVLVEGRTRVHPLLVTKYYDDGGLVGEYIIHDGEHWKFLDASTKFVEETEGEYLGFISGRDHYEYQKGSFDNRKYHYERFDFYAAQIGKTKIESFPKPKTTVSKKVLKLPVSEKIETVRNWLLEGKALHDAGKIGQGNKKLTLAYDLVEILKKDGEGKKAIHALLSDPEKNIWMAMMYQLFELYPDECTTLITEVAKEDSLEGLMAQAELESIKTKGRPDLT